MLWLFILSTGISSCKKYTFGVSFSILNGFPFKKCSFHPPYRKAFLQGTYFAPTGSKLKHKVLDDRIRHEKAFRSEPYTLPVCPGIAVLYKGLELSFDIGSVLGEITKS